MQRVSKWIWTTTRIQLDEAEAKIYHANLTQEWEENAIKYTEPSKDPSSQYESNEQYLSALEYQRDNIQESCVALGIKYSGPDTINRIKGMPLSQKLMIWQVVGINALLEFYRDSSIRGFILGDQVGLGKTWMLIGFLMTVSATNPIVFFHHVTRTFFATPVLWQLEPVRSC